MEKRVTFQSSGHELVGHLHVPEKELSPGVVLLHGLSNTMTDCPLINEVTAALIGEDYATFRFDYFGSGESPGLLKDKTWEIMLQNTRDAIDFLRSKLRTARIGLWGRSLGSTFAILCADDPRVEALCLASSDVFVTKTLSYERFLELRKKQQELEKHGRALPGTGKYKGPLELKNDFFASLETIEKSVVESLSKLRNTLVLATTPDVKVPLENSIEIINRAREPKRILVFEGLDHAYIGVEGKAVGEISKWYQHFLPSN